MTHGWCFWNYPCLGFSDQLVCQHSETHSVRGRVCNINKYVLVCGCKHCEVQNLERNKFLLKYFLQMRIYIMLSKIFHATFIITFHICSGTPQGPFPPESFLIYILFLCRIETRNLLATLNLEDLGSRTCDPTKAWD